MFTKSFPPGCVPSEPLPGRGRPYGRQAPSGSEMQQGLCSVALIGYPCIPIA